MEAAQTFFRVLPLCELRLWLFVAEAFVCVLRLDKEGRQLPALVEPQNPCLCLSLSNPIGRLELESTQATWSDADRSLAEAMAGLLAASAMCEQLQRRQNTHVRALSERLRLRNEEAHKTEAQQSQTQSFSSIHENVAGLIHALNQPLHTFSGYVELLEEEHLSGASYTQALSAMSRSVQQMVALVASLRSSIRPPPLRWHKLDLCHVLRMASYLSPGRVVWQAPLPVWVLGDGVQLELVFSNLLANAFQMGSQEASIHVFTRGALAIVEILDRGPGVPEALHTQIFQPFFSTQPAHPGLGLSVSSRIIQEHQGYIEVENRPGGGALFRVLLPSPQKIAEGTAL